MEFLSSTEITALLFQLLPGFVAAWVFYGLTPHLKPNQFERVVQALVLLAFVRLLMWPIRVQLLSVPPADAIGEWSPEVEFAWSIVCALVIGVLFSWLANKDCVHGILRWCSITKRTSFPSEWASTFNRDVRFVVLHLKNGNRAMGAPIEFPDHPDTGHFVLADARWLCDDGSEPIELAVVERLLIRAAEVDIVETLKEPQETEPCVTESEIRPATAVINGNQTNGKPKFTAPRQQSRKRKK